jgi:hypothetical protein
MAGTASVPGASRLVWHHKHTPGGKREKKRKSKVGRRAVPEPGRPSQFAANFAPLGLLQIRDSKMYNLLVSCHRLNL